MNLHDKLISAGLSNEMVNGELGRYHGYVISCAARISSNLRFADVPRVSIISRRHADGLLMISSGLNDTSAGTAGPADDEAIHYIITALHRLY